jgi:hypothetical protein
LQEEIGGFLTKVQKFLRYNFFNCGFRDKRKETGDGRQETGDRRREAGDGRQETGKANGR